VIYYNVKFLEYVQVHRSEIQNNAVPR
jgi:hypothetical protein